jgi:hypothetical protein
VVVPLTDVTIRNLSSGQVLTVTGADQGVKVGQCASRNGDDIAQQWRLVPAAGVRHQYQIQTMTTGMVLEVTGESRNNKARVSLWRDNGGDHQRWRLIPVGEGKHEYAIINVHSGKALDLLDGAWDEYAPLAQVGYWHGIQQRWILTACDAHTTSRAVLTMVRNESVFLPIWLRYYRQFFPIQDIYVIDHQSTDGSTEGDGFTRIVVTRREFGTGWQRDTIQRYQHELVDNYDVVLCTDVDEILAPDPRLGDLGSYIDFFNDDFVTCRGYEVIHKKDHEPPFDPTAPVLEQRSTWYANPSYSKSLLARVPMLWHGGFHKRVDDRKNNDPNLYMIHLHRMDYDICLARHQERVSFPRAQTDLTQGWGYQNRITDPDKFTAWFFHDIPRRLEPIPPWWRSLV